MERRLLVVGVLAMLLCMGSHLQFCWAEQDAETSSCLPLGEPPQADGLHSFTTFVPFYGVHIHSCMQRRTGSIILHNWETHNFIAGEILVYMNLVWEESEVSRFVWDTNSSSTATLAQISLMVQSSAAASTLDGGTVFVPQHATIFSWRIRESGNEEVIFQAVLATADDTSFLVLKYCTDNLRTVSPPVVKTAIVEGMTPILLFRDSLMRRPLYVLRMDRITCTEDAHYYCITGPPHNFSLLEVTATTAKFSFQEVLHINSTVYTAVTIHYTVSCSTKLYNKESGSMVEAANASTAAMSEVKQVEVAGLRPFYNYTCRLLKDVVHLNQTTVHPQPIQLITGEAVPTAAPRDVRVINVTSKSAVIVWSPIPPHLANGDVRYIVRISAVSTSHYTIEESSRETVLMVTGIEAETVHLVTVTGHTGKGAGPGSKVTSFRTQKYNAPITPSGPVPSTNPSKGVDTLSTHIHVITSSSIPTPTSDVGLGTGEGASTATPGDVAAIFMAVLYIVTIAMVVLIVAVVLMNRHLTEKNSQTYDVRTKEDIPRTNSPELVWYQPGDGGVHVQIKDDKDAVSSTSC